jgi:hypothetical protein
MGITPYRLIRPTVGLMPTSMVRLAGLRIEPDVSVPTLAAHKLAAVPMPELEPPAAAPAGRRSRGGDRGAGRTG